MNQYTSPTFDREANAKRYIEERTPWAEYAGGFTHCDGGVYLRCKTCGNVQYRSMISVRKSATSCKYCREADVRQKKQEREQARAIREERLRLNRIERETELFITTRLVECEECGTIFATHRGRQVTCSAECSRKRGNRMSSHRKDARIAFDKRIDKDITVHKLYERDGGVCWICGGKCDKEDYTVKNGTIICGNNYPSIDHVIPIVNGGTDAWDNVKLAHRHCNSQRFWEESIAPVR